MNGAKLDSTLERVRRLKQEIAEIRSANAAYAEDPSHTKESTQADTERRHRLWQIMSELQSMVRPKPDAA